MTHLGAQRSSPGSVCFADIQRFLTLFAQGLAGSFLHLKLIESEAAGRRRSRTPADGANIRLPASIGHFAKAEHNLGAYRIAVLHQIGYLVEGTLDFPLEHFMASWHRPALLCRVFMIVEDLRIDAALRRRYPGATADLDRVLEHARAQRPRTPGRWPLSVLLEALLHYSLGAPRSELLPHDSSGLLEAIIDAAAPMQQPGAAVQDSAQASLAICRVLERCLHRSAPRAPSADAPENIDEQARIDQAHIERNDDELGGLDVDFRGPLMLIQPGKRRRAGPAAGGQAQARALPSADAEPETTRRADRDPDVIATQFGAIRESVNEGPRSFLYDEWDYRRQSYLTAWCRVYEHRLRGDNFDFIGDVRRRHAGLSHQVRRQFAFLKPQSLRRVRGTSDGDELELDRVIEAVIDRRVGHGTDSHLYLRRDRAQRDVAAVFLVDMSASTDFPVPDPAAIARTQALALAVQTPESGGYLYGGHDDSLDAPSLPRRRVIDVSKDALVLMCDALQALGDSFAIYGFSGDGRDNVEFLVAKEFADRLSGRTWAALSAMQPRRSTRMGPAVRHALSKLARVPARMKVLITVSDGYPEDQDYGADRHDREYGIQDTAQAFQEAERAGIVDFCITIDPAGHDYLRRMCAQSRYLVIDDVSSLPRELTKIYRTLTT